MVTTQVFYIIVLSTIIFLIAPAALIFYVSLYNKRKKKHDEEKKLMKQLFDNELIKSRMEVREQTLQTLASELHDNIGQILSLASITLSFIDPNHLEDCSVKISHTEELVKQSITELRRLSQVLYGEQLLSKGLVTAIQTQLGWLEKTGRYVIHFSHHGISEPALEPEKEVVSFRLFQEVVSNIIKHADADTIDVMLEATDKQLVIKVIDNGKGFDVVAQRNSGLGLETVRKRAMLMGGQVNIISERSLGTTFIITIPYIYENEFTG